MLNLSPGPHLLFLRTKSVLFFIVSVCDFFSISGIISDTQSLKVACDNIGVKTRGMETPVSLTYSLGTEGDGVFFNEHGLMCTFTMRTLDAV